MLRVAGGVCFLFWAASIQATPFIQGITPLTGGTNTLTVVGLSADGSTVFGNSNGTNGFEAFRYRIGPGTVGLGDLPGGGFSSFAEGASQRGDIVIGKATPSTQRGFYWTQTGGMVQLPDWPNGTTGSRAEGISRNGQIVVGQTSSLDGLRPMFWPGVSPPSMLADLPGGTTAGIAYDASYDGVVIVGSSSSANGTEATLWTGNNAFGLGDLAGGPFLSEAEAVNETGNVVVGRAWGQSSTAFRWDAQQGMIALGNDAIGGPAFNARAFAVNATGSVIVGRGNIPQDAGFYWTAATGMVGIESLLAAHGVNLTGFDITEVRGISADGFTIAGNGFWNNVITGWVARLNPALIPNTVTVNVDLQNFLTPTGEEIIVQVYNGSVLAESFSLPLRADGKISFTSNRAGSRSLRIRGRTWIYKAVPVTIGTAHQTVSVSLINGDINGDNEVGAADFSQLAAAYDAVPEDPNFVRNADLNGDEEVGAADFSILAANYDEVGE